jgi:hypothetical protein
VLQLSKQTLDLHIIINENNLKTMKDLKQKKEQVYQQTKLAQILKPFDKLEALLDWAIYELQKKDKK